MDSRKKISKIFVDLGGYVVLEMDYDFSKPTKKNYPQLVFIHGAGGDKAQWELHSSYFQKLGWGVLTLSLPGHGKSNKITEISITNYAKNILKLISILEIKNISLVGHSMGGGIALQLILNDKNKLFQNLVLISTGAKLKVAPLFFELIEKDFNKALQSMRDFGYNKRTHQSIKEKNEEILRRTGSNVLLNDFKACNEFDVRKNISSIHTPTLIICGENDLMTPSKFSSYMHEEISDSELTIIPSAGHFVFLECPDEVNETIQGFLQSKS